MSPGEIHTFVNPLWIRLIPGLAALALMGIALWYLLKRDNIWMFPMGLGLLVALLIGPNFFLERVMVDDERLTHRTGFWFWPTTTELRFADIESIVIGTQRERYGAGSSTEEQIWHVQDKRGQTEAIDVSDLWERNSKEIVRLLEARGVEVKYSR